MTGLMVNIVKNIASPTITWLGGMVWVPMACLTNPRTTSILVNEVVMRRIAGATARTVKTAIIFKDGTMSSAPLPSAKLILKVGTLDSANARAELPHSKPRAEIRRRRSLEILAARFTWIP